MEFVFSFWYIVLAVLAVAIGVCLFIYFKMSKKDDVLIKDFIKEQTTESETSQTESTETVVEIKE